MSEPLALEPRKRPSQDRSRQRVERILEATRELVLCQPLEAVTTGAIAERAGLPIGSLYQYFPNRLAVLAELARQVLGAIDHATARTIEAAHTLPWREAIRRVVDTHLAAYRADRCAPILRAFASTEAFREFDAALTARIAGALAAHPALDACGPARERVARVAVEAAGAVQACVLREESAEEAEAIADEMKRLLEAYLGSHIAEGAVASAPPASRGAACSAP